MYCMYYTYDIYYKNKCCCCKVTSVVSNSMRPHRGQPTRLPRPWDSPGKNTGVGCHFLLQCMKVKSESEVALSCPTLSDRMDCSLPGSSVHGIFQARVLEWVAISFSKGSSRPRDQTWVYRISCRHFTIWDHNLNYCLLIDSPSLLFSLTNYF